MSFEPEELWGLHLRREGPAHTAEDGGGGDGGNLFPLSRSLHDGLAREPHSFEDLPNTHSVIIDATLESINSLHLIHV